MANFERVCSKKDFVNNRYLATGDGKPVAIFQIDGQYYGISNQCAHMGGPLVDGHFDRDGHVVCPWHGYRYDPKTGKAPKGLPECVETYAIKLEGDNVNVSTEPASRRKTADEELEFTVESPQPQDNRDFVWKCLICMEEYGGSLPPKVCSKCRAPHELIQSKEKILHALPSGSARKATYPIEEYALTEYLTKRILSGSNVQGRVDMWRSIAEQPPIDVLIISASAHPHHIVSGFIAPKIIEHLKEAHPGTTLEWVDLSKHKIEHNWACYSLADESCRFPCNNMHDDMRTIYPKIVRAKSLMICSAINWEGMNSHLKIFLDRLTNMQDVGLVVERVDWAGRPVGIFVNGHEDGAYKVAWDIFLILQNLGYILPPFGIWYNLSNLAENTKSDLQKLRNNPLAISRLNKVTDNVVHFMQLRIDKQLAWEPEGEKLRRVHYVAM
jgi:nitrite reductase/ring-hydroxylating ferredoxin subunit/multimeric flavodoxin WrbA